MNCTKCNAPLAEGQLYCPQCGDQFEVNKQRAKVSASFADTKNILLKQTKHPIFLVVAILFSVMFASQLSSVASGFFGIVLTVITFVCMLLSTIGLWRSFAAKDPAVLGKTLRSASVYDAFNSVMCTIGIVLVSILGAIGAVASFFTDGLLATEAEDGMEVLEEGMEAATSTLEASIADGIITCIVVLVCTAVTITILSLYKGVFKKRRRYFVSLADTAVTGKYAAAKAPVIGSYIVGGAIVLGACALFAVPSIVASMLSELPLGDSMIDVVNAVLSGFLFSGIVSLVTGAYLILSAVWMAMTHKLENANREVIKTEYAALEAVENATRDAILAADRKRREEEEAKKKAEEEEAKKAQADFAAQQQQIMRMMMMQMMQQSGVNFANMANGETVEQPAEEAAVEEATEEVAEEATEEVAAEEAAEEVAEEATEEAAEEATEEVAEEATEEVAEEAAEEVAEEATEEAVEEATEEAVEEAAEEAAEEATEEVAEEAAEEVVE